MRLRFALIERFFPHARSRLDPLFSDSVAPGLEAEAAPDDGFDAPRRPGRNQAFRRKVLEIYDYQCAACGLRIKMPDVSDLTFVDAGNRRSLIYHRPDCPDYGKVSPKNRVYFDSESAAEAAGFRKARNCPEAGFFFDLAKGGLCGLLAELQSRGSVRPFFRTTSSPSRRSEPISRRRNSSSRSSRGERRSAERSRPTFARRASASCRRPHRTSSRSSSGGSGERSRGSPSPQR
jgi:hypothetical protein